MLSTWRLPCIPVGIVQQGGEVAVAPNSNIATATALSPIGATHRFAPFASEGTTPRTTGASRNPYLDAIDEHVRNVNDRLES